MRRLALAITAAAAAFAAHAQEADTPIGLEEWRALTEGKTVWYRLDGSHWGREFFHRNRDVATFITHDGDCVTAPWTYADGVYCFAYSGLHCFRHYLRGDEIIAAPLGGGPEQVVEKITEGPLSCEPALSS